MALVVDEDAGWIDAEGREGKSPEDEYVPGGGADGPQDGERSTRCPSSLEASKQSAALVSAFGASRTASRNASRNASRGDASRNSSRCSSGMHSTRASRRGFRRAGSIGSRLAREAPAVLSHSPPGPRAGPGGERPRTVPAPVGRAVQWAGAFANAGDVWPPQLPEEGPCGVVGPRTPRTPQVLTEALLSPSTEDSASAAQPASEPRSRPASVVVDDAVRPRKSSGVHWLGLTPDAIKAELEPQRLLLHNQGSQALTNRARSVSSSPTASDKSPDCQLTPAPVEESISSRPLTLGRTLTSGLLRADVTNVCSDGRSVEESLDVITGTPLIRKRNTIKPRPAAPLCEHICGRCAKLPVALTATRFPDLDIASEVRDEWSRLRTGHEGSRPRPSRTGSPKQAEKKAEWLPHWSEDLAQLAVPPAPLTSAFSRKRPHPKWGHLTTCEFTRLNICVTQARTREPLQRAHYTALEASLGTACFRQMFREARDDFEYAALRMCVQAPPVERTAEDLQLLMAYFRQREFFKDLTVSLLAEATNHFLFQRIEEGEDFYREGNEADSIVILFRGAALLRDSSGLCRETPQGTVFGVGDIFEEDRASFRPRPQPKRLHTVEASADCEILVLRSTDILPLLAEEALCERLWVLQELFKSTIGKKRTELLGPSNIERMGEKVPVVDLFEVWEAARHHTFFQQGEKLPPAVARITVVISGTVVRKARGRIMHEDSTGAILGEEAWIGESYQTTALCTSTKARVMSISVADYVEQFHSHSRITQGEQDVLRAHILDSQPQEFLALHVASQWNRQKSAALNGQPDDKKPPGGFQFGSPRAGVFAEQMRKAATVNSDREAVDAALWQVVRHKRMPKRVAPLGLATAEKRQADDLDDVDLATGTTRRPWTCAVAETGQRHWRPVPTVPRVAGQRPASERTPPVAGRRPAPERSALLPAQDGLPAPGTPGPADASLRPLPMRPPPRTAPRGRRRPAVAAVQVVADVSEVEGLEREGPMPNDFFSPSGTQAVVSGQRPRRKLAEIRGTGGPDSARRPAGTDAAVNPYGLCVFV